MDNAILLRFNDHTSETRPVDTAGSLDDLDVAGALTMPAVVDAVTGKGREFTPGDATGLEAVDIDSGSTLLNRAVSVQAILDWDFDGQDSYGSPGIVIARGKGTSAAEYMAFAIELRVVNHAAGIGEIRFVWHDSAGVLKTQVGAHFQALRNGTDRAFVMLTASRRWVSTTEVVCRYYVGDELIGETTSVDGDIGGGTTGSTTIGARYTGAAYDLHFAGILDELRVVERELAPEEVAATWKRITVEQPNACALVRELHPPGFPMPTDLSTRVQRETTVWGNVFGFAMGQAENLRANFFPSRAYGPTLEAWEAVTKQPPKPGDSLDIRRARVVGKIRRRSGVSLPGVREAIEGLVDTDVDNLEIVAFDQTTLDEWATLNDTRWRHEPSAQWTIAANALRAQGDGNRAAFADWLRSTMSVQADGRAAAMFSKVTPATLASGSECGLLFVDRALRNAFLLGYRNNAGAYQIVTESMLGGVLGGATVHGVLGGLVPAWLALVHDDADGVTLSKINSSGWDGGAISVETLAGDGYVEATATLHGWAALGLEVTPTTVDPDPGSDYFVYTGTGDGFTALFVSTAAGGDDTGETIEAGDVIRLGRTGSSVWVKKNGVLVYTFANTTAAALTINARLSYIGSTIANVRLVDDGAEVPINWIDDENVRIFDGRGTFGIKWATAAASGPFSEVAGIGAGFGSFQWAGFYARNIAAIAGSVSVDVAIDDTRVRAPYGDRSFRFYTYRDPALAGDPDILGANGVIAGLRQAHTIGRVVTTLAATYDSDDTTYDDAPMGGI